MNPVTDQAILDQLNGKPAGGLKPVTDPRLLMQLDGVPDSVIGGDSNAYVQQVVEAHKRHNAGEPVANIKKSLNEALAKQPAIHGQPKPPQAQGWGDWVMQGPVGQIGLGALEGASRLPGMPVDAIVGGGNFLRRQFNMPETSMAEAGLQDWGGQGWYDSAQRNLGVPQGPTPTDGLSAFARKVGNFAGGSAVLGPAGMVPGLYGAAGSEVGALADKVAPGLTGGYGEFAGGVIGGGYKGARDAIKTPAGVVKAPTTAELKAAATQAYDTADNAGVVFTGDGLMRVAADAETFAAGRGFRPSIHPNVHTALNELLADAAKGNSTLKGLDTLRQSIRDAASGINVKPAEKAMIGHMVEKIDDLIKTPQTGDVLMGDAKAGATALSQARDLFARKSRAERVDQLLAAAEHRAANTGSGGNVNNAIRQEIGKITNPLRPWNARGFTPQELAQAKLVSRGTNLQNALRGLGAMGPSGNGLGANLHLGAALVSGGTSAPISLALAGIKHIAEGMTKAQAAKLSEMIRAGGPLRRQQTPIAGAVVPVAVGQVAQPTNRY